MTQSVRVAVVASAQIFGGFQNLPPPQSLDFSAFFGLSHLFPPRLSISVIFDTDLVTLQLSEKIDPVGMERISPKKVSRLILQSLDALSKIGIFGMVRRSNGKRLIELRRAESDDAQGVPVVAPVDPVGALCGDLREIAGHGE